jgi:hypothetical protein
MRAIFIDITKMPYYLGTTDLNLFLSSLLFGFIGILIMVLIDLSGRNPNTNYSPVKFSWVYFLKDNVIRFILNVILVLVTIRFLPELLSKPINQFSALLVGIGADKLAAMVKRKKEDFLGKDENINDQNIDLNTQK